MTEASCCRTVPVHQVDYVEPSQNTISLKMIPRIDLDRIKAKMSLVGVKLAHTCAQVHTHTHALPDTPLSLCDFAERLVCQEEEVQETCTEAFRRGKNQVAHLRHTWWGLDSQRLAGQMQHGDLFSLDL